MAALKVDLKAAHWDEWLVVRSAGRKAVLKAATLDASLAGLSATGLAASWVWSMVANSDVTMAGSSVALSAECLGGHLGQLKAVLWGEQQAQQWAGSLEHQWADS